MNLIYKLKNHKLRYKEKFGNSYHRQIFRLLYMTMRHPIQSSKQGILKVMIGLTYRCQCDCIYCCSGKYPKVVEKELSTDGIKSIIDQIACMPSLFSVVSFFGGEAMLREDIYWLIEYAAKKGLFTEIESNGILLTRENVIRLKKRGLHHIFIRLEGSKSETHDALSKYEGCFGKAIEAIKNCVREKLACTISTIALKEKIYNNELQSIINLGKRLGVTSVRILHPTDAGNWLNEESHILSEDEKAVVGKLLELDFVYLESTYSAKKEIGRICPSARKKFFYISPYGEVQACPFVSLVFGKLSSEKLSDILKKMWQRPIFSNKDYEGCFIDNIMQ